MRDGCDRWLQKDLTQDRDRRDAVSVIRKLIRGTATWQQLKPMYDAGLVQCTHDGNAVPVSDLAASVLHAALARAARPLLKPVASYSSDAEAGYELEHHLHVLLDCTHETLPVRKLDGTVTGSIDVQTDFALPFANVDASMQAAARAGHVFYVPQGLTCPVDGIIAPKADSGAPVIIVEASMTNPREAARVDKCMKWFARGGIISTLENVFPKHPIVILLCYGKVAMAPPAATATRFMELQNAADSRQRVVRVVVADRRSLEKLESFSSEQVDST